jgi:hypothetical protein
MDETDYTWLIDEYKQVGQIPLLWQWRSREYICAANILRRAGDDTNLFKTRNDKRWKPRRVIRLLYGLALEMQLKGLLVAQGVDATSTGQLNKRLKTHNLLSLWRSAGLPIDQQSEKVLTILHWSIETDRYPVGTKPEVDAPRPYMVASATVNQILKLIETAEAALHKTERLPLFDNTDLRKLCSESA